MVTCPYCKEDTELTTGKTVYPHRPDLWYLRFYVCEPCDARVGCHGNTTKPLGTPANAELRKIRMQAHDAFDPVWKSGTTSRSAAYGWLAEALGIKINDCHIGQFNTEACQQVIGLCHNNRLTKQKENYGN